MFGYGNMLKKERVGILGPLILRPLILVFQAVKKAVDSNKPLFLCEKVGK